MFETFEEVYQRFYAFPKVGEGMPNRGPCYAVARDFWKAASEKFCSSLSDMVENARLLKQCAQYDGCDICKAELLLKEVRDDQRP